MAARCAFLGRPVWIVPCCELQLQQADAHQSQHAHARLQGVGLMKLTLLDTAPRLEAFVIFLNKPTQRIPMRHIQGGCRMIHRYARYQNPLDRVFTCRRGGRLPYANNPAT